MQHRSRFWLVERSVTKSVTFISTGPPCATSSFANRSGEASPNMLHIYSTHAKQCTIYSPRFQAVERSVINAAAFLSTTYEPPCASFTFTQMLQCDDGHWGGDYGGPMFLMPGLIVAFHVTGASLGETRRAGMETYLRNHQQVRMELRKEVQYSYYKKKLYS